MIAYALQGVIFLLLALIIVLMVCGGALYQGTSGSCA